MNEQSNMQAAIDILNENIDKLKREKKRMESLVKDLASQVAEAELVAAKQLAQIRDKVDLEIAEMQLRIVPHKELAQLCETSKATLAATKQAIYDETSKLKEERHAQLTVLDKRISEATTRLGKLHAEEEAFRKRIALV